MSGTLDETDRQLLELLAEDARMPLTGLAQRLGLARSTVQVRLALVRCLTPVDLDRLLDHIGTIPGVERTNSSVLLATRIDRRDPT